MPAGYGKFSIARIEQSVQLARVLPAQPEQLLRDLSQRCAPCGQVLARGVNWASFYENTHQRHIKLFFSMARLFDDDLARSAITPDPHASFARCLVPALESDAGDLKLRRATQVVGLYASLALSMRAAGLFGRTMNGLIDAVARTGREEVLLTAVSVDRTALASTPILNIVSRWQIEENDEALALLRKAMGGTARKPLVAPPELGYLLAVLDEDGSLERINDQDLYELLVDRLALLAPTNRDPVGAVARLRERWVKRVSWSEQAAKAE